MWREIPLRGGGLFYGALVNQKAISAPFLRIKKYEIVNWIYGYSDFLVLRWICVIGYIIRAFESDDSDHSINVSWELWFGLARALFWGHRNWVRIQS